MRWLPLLSLIWILSAAPVEAVELGEPPSVRKQDLTTSKFLKKLKKASRNLTVVTTNPDGNQQGLRGDIKLYNDGTGLRFCRNASTTAEGGTTWTCDAFSDATQICFEGATEDDFETCFSITDPTADRTVTIPNASVNLTLTTPALTLSTTNATGSATTRLSTDATIALFDTTVPTTIAFGDAAATGSDANAARRDHTHGAPAAPAWEFVETVVLTLTSVTSATLPTDADNFMLMFDNVRATSGQLDFRFNGDSGTNYEFVTLAADGTVAGNTGQDSIQWPTGDVEHSGPVYFNRLSATGGHGVGVASVGTSGTILLRGEWVDTDAITTFNISAGGGLEGAVHVYKLGKQDTT